MGLIATDGSQATCQISLAGTKTVVPDSLAWTLGLLKSGKLPSMLERAGYPTIAAALDEDLVADKLREVESTLKAMAEAASK